MLLKKISSFYSITSSVLFDDIGFDARTQLSYIYTLIPNAPTEGQTPLLALAKTVSLFVIMILNLNQLNQHSGIATSF